MRLDHFALLVPVLLASSLASADPGDVSDRPWVVPRLAAHLSVANQLAEAAMNAVIVSPDPASLARLDAAVAPSLVMLDTVIRCGDPYWQLRAEAAKQDIYVGMIVRVRQSLGPAGDSAHDALEVELEPWRVAARDAGETVAQLAHGNPSLARRDPVIGPIVQRSENERGPQIARRASGRWRP